MTIASQTSRISYNGDGSTATFAVPFYFLVNADLVVFLSDSTGQTLQLLGTHYSLSGAGVPAGGSCTFLIAPPAGKVVTIYRDPPVTQTTSYNNNDPFPAKSHENALDKLTMLVQRLRDRVGRSLILSETSSFSGLTLPDPEAGRYLKWKQDNTGLENTADVTFPPNSFPVATQSEAVGGTLNTVLMTPLSVQQTKFGVSTADSLSTASAASLPATTTAVDIAGYAAPGDAPPAPYVSRLSEPAHTGKFYSNGRWYELERHDGVYLEDFGGHPTLNSLDTTYDAENIVALTDSIDYCNKKGRALIRANSGVWRITGGGIVLPVGISIHGAGHSSSEANGGTLLAAAYDEATPSNPFLHWTGSGIASNSTGGGLQNISVRKAWDKTGGTLVRIDGTSITQRSGYMTLQNVILSGTNGAANTDYCLIHDGSAITESSTQGVRDVTYGNVFIDGWVVEGSQFINAAHAKLLGFTASPTNTSLICIRVTGLSSDPLEKTVDMMAFGLQTYGTIILDNVNDSVFAGRMTDLTITGNCTNTTIIPVGNNTIGFVGTIGGVATTRDLLRRTNNTVILDGADDALYVNNTKVVGPRITGVVAPTGTSYTGAWDTGTISSVSSLAQIVKAHDDFFRAHGMMGS